MNSSDYINARNKIGVVCCPSRAPPMPLPALIPSNTPQTDAENVAKLAGGLAMSRELLLGGISGAFDSKLDKSLEERLGQLEEVLLQADIGTSTSAVILDDLRCGVLSLLRLSHTPGLSTSPISLAALITSPSHPCDIRTHTYIHIHILLQRPREYARTADVSVSADDILPVLRARLIEALSPEEGALHCTVLVMPPT